MPWSGGKYTRTNGVYAGSDVWQADAQADVEIRADRHDVHDQDLADGVDNCLNRSGQNAVSGNIDWGTFRIVNMGTPVAANDAATKGYVDGVTPVVISDLDDVDATGAPNAQLLKYDSTLGVWRNGWAQWTEVTGKPSFATVATSGAYADLTGKPSVPADIGDLDDVDTSGAIDGSVLKYQSGTWVVGVDGGGGGGATSFLGLTDTPVSYSGQANRFLRVNGAATGVEFEALATVASSGSYNDLSDLPSLAPVATSGSYNDLTSKPSIPTVITDMGDVSGSPSNGQILKFNSTSGDWEPANESSSSVNLAQSRTATAVTVTNTAGTDATLSQASDTYAGVMTAANKTKLDGIATNADVTATALNALSEYSTSASNHEAIIRLNNGSLWRMDLPDLKHVGGCDGQRISIRSTAPSSPSVGDIWIQI